MDAAAGPRPTAGVVIIGNEILSGKVADANAAFFIQRFRALGVRLAEVAFVEDTREAIAETVRRLASRFDIVCTSGGVGPTHDDVTIEGIAAAFDVPVVESPVLRSALTTLLAGRLKPGHLRMARVPEGTEIEFGEDREWPAIRCRNVYVFPGVPWLLRTTFKGREAAFQGPHEVATAELALLADEATICEALDALVVRHPSVDFGSYPRWVDGRWRIRLTVEGTDADAVATAHTDARSTFADVIADTEASPASH